MENKETDQTVRMRRLIKIFTLRTCQLDTFVCVHYAEYRSVCTKMLGMIELFAHCKGGNFNIHIRACFDYFICKTREIRFYLYFGEEIISCLGRANVRAFHENPNRIHTELTFINP